MTELSNSLPDWFNTSLGKYLLDKELALYDKASADIFGFNSVQLGLPEIDFIRANRMPFRIKLDADKQALIRSRLHELPLATQSIDLVALPHVFEFSHQPHQILREVERILMPEGQVLISVFNPWSLWGIRRLLDKNQGDYPWCGRFISLPRIKDWLALLGFDVIAGRVCCYAPPCNSAKWRHRFDFMEHAGDRWWALAGGVYFLQAKKKVHGIRLITPNWKDRLATREVLAAARQKSTVTQRKPINEQ